MSAVIRIEPLTVDAAMSIERQASQMVQLGISRRMNRDDAEALVAGIGEKWAVIENATGRTVACFGLAETFPGKQGVAWAILAEGIGTAHLAMTRFCRARVAASPLVRIEAIVRTPSECVWAKMIGLTFRCALPCFGALSQTHFLYDKVQSDG